MDSYYENIRQSNLLEIELVLECALLSLGSTLNPDAVDLAEEHWLSMPKASSARIRSAI